SARLARAAEAVARACRAPRPRFRHAGRREGGGGAGARTPPDAASGALGAARLRRGHRARPARDGADAGRRGSRGLGDVIAPGASPKLAGYAVLAAAGLLASLVLSRPEIVALTAPFLLALAVGLTLAAPPQVAVDVRLDDDRLLEGDETTARIVLRAGAAAQRVDMFLWLPPGL